MIKNVILFFSLLLFSSLLFADLVIDDGKLIDVPYFAIDEHPLREGTSYRIFNNPIKYSEKFDAYGYSNVDFQKVCKAELYIPASDNRWFLGEYHAADEHEYIDVQYSCSNVPDHVCAPMPPVITPYQKHLAEKITGTDLGASVSYKGKTWIYLGDTYAKMPQSKAMCQHGNGCEKLNIHEDCAPNAECNDAILVLDNNDNDPADGIRIEEIIDDSDLSKFKPLIIPGVHNNHPVGIWGESFNVPTGAATITVNGEEKIVVFYITAATSNPKVRRFLQGKKFVHPKSRSWVGCSTDGHTFENCYPDANGTPFSRSKVKQEVADKLLNAYNPWIFSTVQVKNSYEALDRYSSDDMETGKFIYTNPVTITIEDFNRICSNETENKPLCKLPEKNGGLLLFGSSAPYRRSHVFMAYIDQTDFGKSFSDGRPRVKYFTGTAWTNDEKDAAPILQYRNGSLNPNSNSYGEFSVKIIRDGVDTPKLIMLHHSEYGDGTVYFRSADLAHPENLANEYVYTGHHGYGPYIIDKYTTISNGNLHIWHFLSSWLGRNSLAPYGVFSTETVIHNFN